jgi:hypothetical protein
LGSFATFPKRTSFPSIGLITTVYGPELANINVELLDIGVSTQVVVNETAFVIGIVISIPVV